MRLLRTICALSLLAGCSGSSAVPEPPGDLLPDVGAADIAGTAEPSDADASADSPDLPDVVGPWERPAPWLSACMTDPACPVPLITAHRGEGAGAPENSVAAITASAALGADMVEIDIRQSADGVPVIMHDGTLARTTNQPDVFPDVEEVEALTLAELKQLVLKDPEGLCAPETAEEQAARCRIPTLAEALEAARGTVLLMLDFKDADVVTVAELVAAHDALDTALLFDSNLDLLDTAEATAPGLVTMPRAKSTEEALQILAARAPAVLHIDAEYVAEVVPAAAQTGTRLFLNVLVEVDGYLILYALTEDDVDLQTGEEVLHGLLDAGTGVVQTNYAPALRPMVDAWCEALVR